MKKYLLKNNKGFSLIELVAVIVLVGIITAGMSPIIIAVVDIWQIVSFREDRGADLKIAMDWIEREARAVKDDTSIITADSDDFRFLDTEDNDINFYLSGTNLYRNSNILLSGVQSLNFRYYDEQRNVGSVQLSTPLGSGSLSPNATPINRMEIDITVQAGSQTLTLSSGIFFRNLRD